MTKDKIVGCWILSLFMAFGLSAQTKVKEGKNIIAHKKIKNINFQKQWGTVTSDKAEKPWETTLTVTTTQQPDFFYKLALKIPLIPTDIKAGEILLLSFQGKTNHSLLETGEARSLWLLNVSDNPKEKIATSVSIASNWQQYHLPIKIEKNISKKQLNLTLQFGYPVQEFLLKNIRFRVFKKDTPLADLPKTEITYQGMEANAVWRKKANERIEKHRKGDFQLCFTENGKPVGNRKIQVTLKRHHFSWGAAISARKILQDKKRLDYFSKAFNLAVFENDLKIKFWNKKNRIEQVLETIQLLEERNIDVKGHVLIWPGFSHLTKDFKKYENNPQKIRDKMDKHVADILQATKGKISRWDVVNEAYTNQDLQTITGSEEILYHGFRELHKIDPNVLRFTNEYGIISKGGLDKKKQQWYYEYLKRLDKNINGLLDGIGIQCHIGSDLTPPKKILEILDYYAQLGKKISISEFTMDIKDYEVRRQYSKDFITAAFSHPSVSEFLFWGYDNPDKADIFTENWEYGAMGEAYFPLVHDEWKTNIVADTNRKGQLNGRGFYGTYEYTYVSGDKVVKGNFEMLPANKNSKTIEIHN